MSTPTKFILPLLLIGMIAALMSQQNNVRGLPVDPPSEDRIELRDEFMGGQGGNTSIGTLGWSNLGVGGGSNTYNGHFYGGTIPNVGRAIAPTAGTPVIDQGVIMTFGINGFSDSRLGRLDTNANWDLRWVASISELTDPKWRVGLFGDAETDTHPANGGWVRFDTSATYNDDVDGAGGRFWFETCSASTCTEVESSVTVAASTFYLIRIRSVVPGTWLMSINGGTEQSMSTNVPTVDVGPGVHMTSARAGGARITSEVDFFSFAFTAGINR